MNLSKVFTKAIISSPDRRQEADGDLLIVKQVQAGDVAAFDKLILKYRERLFGIVYNLTANREDTADLVQESFIKAFQSINRFQGHCSFFTWLYKITINATLGHLRKNRLRSFFSLEKFHDDGTNADIIERLTDSKGADRDIYLKELQEKLNEALQKLSIPHRTVITLFEIDGLSHSDIAGVMNCSEGTVRSRLHYAKQFLQGEMGKYLRS